MKIKIDIREKTLIQLLKALIHEYNIDTTLIIENLHLGDVIFFDEQTDKDIIIIERKNLNDLASSIRDGRYAEQSLRLSHIEIPNHNIFYLIEGNMNSYNNKYTRVPPSTLYSSMFSIQYYKGFSMIRSFDIQETAEIIIRYFIKLTKETHKNPYFNTILHNNEDNVHKIQSSIETNSLANPQTTNTQRQITSSNYCEVIKKVKKDNITPENIGSIILSQIPGISNVISQVVMDKFGSLYDLMIALKENTNILNNIKYTTKNGQERRISHKAISSIKSYLLYRKDNTITIDI